jgi:tryptophan synthase alpha chain
MSRIEELFKKKRNKILNVYCTAGFPRLEDTLTVMAALAKSGADTIELGMPYSDPLADGPVIQQSSTIALQNGMTIKKLFEQLRGAQKESRKRRIGEAIPVLLMGYMNPVLNNKRKTRNEGRGD